MIARPSPKQNLCSSTSSNPDEKNTREDLNSADTTFDASESTTEPINVNNNSLASGSRVAVESEQYQWPTIDQAIVIDAIENVPVVQYLYALGELIAPIDITHISRISRGRVCVYVRSVAIAEKLCNEIRTITIADATRSIRPFRSRGSRNSRAEKTDREAAPIESASAGYDWKIHRRKRKKNRKIPRQRKDGRPELTLH